MESNLMKFLLVLVFAGSVVALGAHELQQRYRAKYGSRGGANRNFFERINEHTGSLRARLAPEEVSRAAEAKAEGDKEEQQREDGLDKFVEKLVP